MEVAGRDTWGPREKGASTDIKASETGSKSGENCLLSRRVAATSPGAGGSDPLGRRGPPAEPEGSRTLAPGT